MNIEHRTIRTGSGHPRPFSRFLHMCGDRAPSWFCAALLFFLSVQLAGCTRVKVKDTLTRPQADLFWPRTGDAPRVRFLANIASPDDLFVRRKWMGLVDLVAGRADLSFGVPFDVYLTDDNLLLVTDTGKGCVHFIDLTEYRYREVRSLGREETLEQPVGVTADASGFVYVSDSLLGNVFVFDREGKFLRPLAAEGVLKRPADLVYCAKTGLICVVDVIAHEVKAFRADGTLVRTIGGPGAEEESLNFPTHIWTDREGTVYVTSSMDFAVKIYDAGGGYLSSFGEHGDTPGFFSRPKGVATDPAGHIYVVDAIFDNFQIFNRGGSLLLTVGESGSDPGELYLPAGIFIDSKARMFLADQQNHRVAVFEYLEVGAP